MTVRIEGDIFEFLVRCRSAEVWSSCLSSECSIQCFYLFSRSKSSEILICSFVSFNFRKPIPFSFFHKCKEGSIPRLIRDIQSSISLVRQLSCLCKECFCITTLGYRIQFFSVRIFSSFLKTHLVVKEISELFFMSGKISSVFIQFSKLSFGIDSHSFKCFLPA